MLTITTNNMSLNVQNCLTASTKGLTRSLERMSTGMKINSAADDAAGLYVSCGLNAQTRGIHQAMQNIQTASTLLMTAEGGVTCIYSCLSRVRDLCIQALNGTYSEDSLTAMQNEANKQLTEAQRIKNSTEFNGLFMLGNTTAEESAFTKKVMTVEEATAEALAHPRTDIIEIKTAADLQNIKNHLGAIYVLANDIDLSGIDWEPIGTDIISAFQGKLYGCGHKITGLTVNSTSEYAGLFGYVDGGIIRDLVVEGARVENTNSDSYGTGVIAGYMEFESIIDNCAVINSTIQSSGYITGGLVGYCNYSSTITNSYSTSSVTGNIQIGGLVGSCDQGSKIINSYSTGSVSGDIIIGGLVGSCGEGTILNSYSTGSATGNDCTGGLTGILTNAIIQNSYASGDVLRKEGSETTFGECYGYDDGPDWDMDPSTIENTYAKNQTGAWFGTIQENVGLINPITSSSMGKLNDGVGAGKWDLSGTTPMLETNNEKTHTSGGVNTDLIENPYNITYISSAEDLMKMKNNLEGTYILTADIDLSGIDWEPVGDYSNTFTGKLYGCGHKITGLTINSTSDCTGLFGHIENAIIKDLQIDGANVTSTKAYTGTLVGYAGRGTIDNVAITNTTVNGSKNYTGGLTGDCGSGTISNSYVTGSVTGDGRTGGLTGCCNNGTISNSYSAADVEGIDKVGGCVGELSYSSKLLNTYSLGSVSGEQQTGGLVGDINVWSSTQISNCYANGEIERTSGTATTFGNLYGYTDDETYMTVANNYALKQDGDYFGTTQVGTTILDELTSDQMESLNTATGDAPADQWDMSLDRPQLKTNKEHSGGTTEPVKIRLQIGEYGDENNVIYVETGLDLEAFQVDFSSPESIEACLDKVDEQMNSLNNKQSEFGVVQNRLKSVLQGLTTREENATAAKSTISDCDMAEESSNYVQQQILQQTSSALLVQANSLPQIALMLINGE